MKIKRLFLHCDILGKTQNFTIAKRKSYRTYFGSFISLGLIGILTYLMLYFGLEIFLRRKPNVIITTYNEENPPETLIDDSKNIFALALENPDYNVYINDSIYTLNASIVKLSLGETGYVTRKEPITLTRCSEYKFKFLNDYFSPLDLSNLYCLNTTKPYMIKGEFSKSEWIYLEFQFNKCVNSTENHNSCMPQEEINARLKGGYLGLFISHSSVIPTNFKEPFHTYGKNVFSSFSINQYTDFWMYLKHLIVQTDNGIIFLRNKTEKCLVYDSMYTTYDFREGSTFLSLNMRLSIQKEVYERSYTKLQGVVAEMGGVVKFSFVVGELLVYFVREMLYRDFLLSFFFDELEQKKTISTKAQENNSFCSNKKDLKDNIKSNNYILNSQTNTSFTKKDFNKTFLSQVNNSIIQQNNTLLSFQNNISGKIPSGVLKNHQSFPLLSKFLCYVCNANARTKLKSFNYNYSKIAMLFDVIYYLKERNDIHLLMKKSCKENYSRTIKQYHFELPSFLEQDIFNYYISFKKKKYHTTIT